MKEGRQPTPSKIKKGGKGLPNGQNRHRGWKEKYLPNKSAVPETVILIMGETGAVADQELKENLEAKQAAKQLDLSTLTAAELAMLPPKVLIAAMMNL